VRQIDAPWVKPGQKAYIEIDAFPYRKCDVFEGEVRDVAPEARSAAGGAGASSSMTGLSGSTAPVEVEIRFVNPKWDIKPNYEGTAEIVVQQKARVIEWLLGLSKLELQSSKDAGRPAPSGGRGNGAREGGGPIPPP